MGELVQSQCGGPAGAALGTGVLRSLRDGEWYNRRGVVAAVQGRRKPPFPERGGEAENVVLIREEQGQLSREIRVACQERASIGSGTALKPFEVSRDHLVQTLFAVAIKFRIEVGWVRGNGRHVVASSSLTSSRDCRERS
jgi:hypothetical protein